MKLSLFFAIFSQSRCEEPNASYQAVQEANLAFRNGDLHKAGELFDKYSLTISNTLFCTEYFTFLINIGKYQKLIDYYTKNKVTGIKCEKLVKQAKECLENLKSNEPSKILDLLKISPNSLEVILSYIKSDINNASLDYVEHGLRIAKPNTEDHRKLLDYKCLILMNKKEFAHGLKTLEDLKLYGGIYYEIYNKFNYVYTEFMRIKEEGVSSDKKMQGLNALYYKILEYKQADLHFAPSVYSSIYKTVLDYISQYAVDTMHQDAVTFTFRLYSVDKSEKTVYNYIRALVQSGKSEQARNIMEKHRNELKLSTLRYLEALIEEERKKEREKEEKAKREEERRRHEEERRNQENNQRRLSQNKTNKAGSDFLGYYKTLDAKPSFDIKALKKSYRKAIKNINKKYADVDLSKYPENHSPAEKEKKDVNIAFQCLSDPEKKSLYDNGINPNEPHAAQEQQQYGNENDIADLLNQMFGNRGGFGGGDPFSNFGGFGGFGGGGSSQRRFVYVRS